MSDPYGGGYPPPGGHGGVGPDLNTLLQELQRRALFSQQAQGAGSAPAPAAPGGGQGGLLQGLTPGGPMSGLGLVGGLMGGQGGGGGDLMSSGLGGLVGMGLSKLLGKK